MNTTQIAVIGMAGRFPGAPSVDDFWRLLCDGREGLTRFDDAALAAAGVAPALLRDPAYVKVHGVIPDADLFDAAFFGFTPLEAEMTDPQHRLFLESCHAVLESSGYDPDRFKGLISVYAGASINTYLQNNVLPNVDQTATSRLFQVMVGNDKDYLATRVSYKLNLKGPSYTVQTACSTSLVAIHLACQGLINGECDLALAGGVTVKLPQVKGYLYEDGAILSVDGRVRTFDAAASGTALGNGVGVLALKLLEHAQRDGDTIHAIIRGTATNNDGAAKVSYAAPSREGQAAVVSEAHAVSDVAPDTISYVEAHGTATRLGDPIEVAALTQAFRKGTPTRRFCAIGSVKSNIGHLDAAAGVAGVIKAALMLSHKTLVPAAGFSTPNPEIDFENGPFYVNTTLRPWDSPAPRRAGVSAFGIGGTNAHAVLEEPPAPSPSGPSRAEQLLVLSARTIDALDRLSADLAACLQRDPDLALADVAFTLAIGRQAHRVRRTVVCRSREEAIRALEGQEPSMCRTRELPEPVSAATSVLTAASSVESIRDAWLNGETIDWSRYFAGEQRRRVPLPTYPFDRRRYWLPDAPLLREVTRTAQLHPLVHTNISTVHGQRYESALSGDTCQFADHVVGNAAVLPAAAYLEMARAAGALASGGDVSEISGVTFERPLSLTAARTIHVSIAPRGDRLEFAVESAAGQDEADQTYARGIIEPGAASGATPFPTANLPDVGARCQDVLSEVEAYARLDRLGLHYGPGFQVLRQVALGRREALAHLELRHGDGEGWVLHPALLDGALQTAACCLQTLVQHPEHVTFLPFSVERVVFSRPLPPRCVAHVTVPEPFDFAQGKPLAPIAPGRIAHVDIALFDEDGLGVARLERLGVRVLPSAGAADTRAWFRAEWVPGELPEPVLIDAEPFLLLTEDPSERHALGRALHAAGSGARIVVATPGDVTMRRDADTFEVDLSGPSGLAEVLAHLASDGVEVRTIVQTWCPTLPQTMASVLVHVVQSAAHRRSRTPLRVLVVDWSKASSPRPGHEAVGGLARTIAREHPAIVIRTVMMGDERDAMDRLVSEASSRADANREVRWERGTRLVKRVRPLDTAGMAIDAVPLRDNGVYVITGGAGALGLICANHIATCVRAHIVLAGRAPMTAAVRQRLAPLGTRARSVRYLQLDVTDDAAVRSALADVRASHGGVRGVIHAAGVLGDSLIREKTREHVSAVLAPKVLGTQNLDRATEADPLDFFLTMSSIAGVLGTIGQADYAYANAFMDAYAVWREGQVAAGQRRGRSLSIAWPLWADGGMMMDAAAQADMRDAFGLTALATADGLVAFDEALRLPGGAYVLACGDPDRFEAALATVTSAAATTASDDADEPDEDLRAASAVFLRGVIAAAVKLPAEELEISAPLDRHGIDSLAITSLNRELERYFPRLSKTLFFEYQTIEQLATYFATSHAARMRALTGLSAETRPANRPTSPARVRAADTDGDAASVEDAIAIIGLSGRYPMAEALSEFWQNLIEGRDCITEIPPERWNQDRFFDPDPSTRGMSYARWGGFLRDVDKFDPLFFAISPREAELMDPQERLFLETAWHVVEDAGYRPRDLTRDSVGVFVGVMYGEYQLYGAVDALAGGRSVTGSSFASIANRASYVLNLQGPSLALDTMCSSSLTAIHLACESLRRGESGLAIAGGVNVSIHPYKYVFLSQGRFLSADGRCRAFGEGGTGYVPGEGVGAVLLKPLHRARADRDHIYGVIRGTAVNHGGRVNGYAVPNPNAQQRVTRRALEQAGVSPREISYVEAHGTGTSLGDPIEMTGLTHAFASASPDRQYCAIGSVKSNIGHLESAAGIAGLTKVLLQFKHQQLVPSLHAHDLNTNIDFAASPFVVQRELARWERPVIGGREVLRKAGLSSFGAGGSNAHLVIEEHPRADESASPPPASGPVMVVLSARDEERLREYADRLGRFLANEPVPLADAAWTLQVGREPMANRLALVSADREAVIASLLAFAARNEPSSSMLRTEAGQARASDREIAEAFEQRDPIALSRCWVSGADVDWRRWYDGTDPSDAPRRVSLPAYPFARERYWVPTPSADFEPVRSTSPAPEGRFDEGVFRTMLRRDSPLIADHIIAGRAILAGAAALELMRAAATRAGRGTVAGLRDVTWLRPVFVDTAACEVSIGVRTTGDETAVVLSTTQDGNSTVCVRAMALDGASDPQPARADLDAIRRRCVHRIEREDIYAQYRDAGFDYGRSFQVLQQVLMGRDEAFGALRLPADGAVSGFTTLVPALLDGALRVCHWVNRTTRPTAADLAVPFAMGRIEVYAPVPSTCYARATVSRTAATTPDMRSFDIEIFDETGSAVARIERFVGRVLGDARRAPAPFFYELVWEPRNTRRDPVRTGTRDTLLVFADGTAAAHLAHTGRWTRVIEVSAGTSYARSAADRFSIDPRDATHYRDLVAALMDGSMAVDIINLWGLVPNDGGTIDDGFDRGLFPALYTMQALASAAPAARAKYAFVHGASHGRARPEYEAVAGFARSTIAIAPRFELFTIECPPAALDALLSEMLAAEFASTNRLLGVELRYRDGQCDERRVARVTAPSAATAAAPLKRRGVYLLTGGAGQIGLTFARYLVDRYQARLVWVGRSAIGEAGRAEIGRLEARGAEVLAVQGDVANASDMERVIDAAKARFGHLDGVFHIAGVADDEPATTADRARFDRVLAAKTRGTVHLDRLTRDEPLDLFVLFSSIASVVGDFGACSYAAANRFMDAFATERDRLVQLGERHGRTLAIDWPLWNAGGVDALVTSAERDAYQHRVGMTPLEPAAALQVFERACELPQIRVIPAVGDPERIDAALGVAETAPRVDAPAVPALSARPATDDSDALTRHLVGYLRRTLAGVLKLPEHRIDSRIPFEEYGLDSVMIIESSAMLAQDFADLPPTLFFEHRTLDSLAAYLARGKGDAALRLPGAPRNPPAEMSPDAVPARALDEPASLRQPPLLAEKGDDEIAIIGVSGRYPHAADLDELWDNLRQGKDCIDEVPAARWDAARYFDADSAAPGKSYSRWGGFLSDVEAFDALFFQIPPMQAKMLDPQERLFVETAWAALENAAYTLTDLPHPRFSSEGRDVGVFVGVMWDDYATLGAEESFKGNHVVALDNRASIANRVSYFCDFRGPSVVVDTACSASLVALHMACESVRHGECRYAIAGGVNVSVHPLKYVHLSRKAMLARDGRCRSFGDGGSGYVPGEGVGAVVLKRLSEALADGDYIHAVIKSTAVNHGGRTNGFTVPNPQAQQALIEEVLAKAGVEGRTIGYVEAHGTGTPLGDPIEHTALQRGFAPTADVGPCCALGSIKSSIGHLEGAAGIAGVTKVLLQFRHRQLAPSLHAEQLNPAIDFSHSPFAVQRTLSDWPAAGAPRRALVSSLGAGGTNACVVLEEAPPEDRQAREGDEPELIVLSARSEERLRAYAASVARFLAAADGSTPVTLADLAYTLRAGRHAMAERIAFVAGSLAHVRQTLEEIAAGRRPEAVAHGNASRPSALSDLFTSVAGGAEFLRALIDSRQDAKLAELWASGLAIDWHVLHAARPRSHRRIPLPTYPFARDRHWFTLTAAPGPATASQADGRDVPAVTTRTIDADDPVVRDHIVDGVRILPGVAHLDLALRTAGGDTVQRAFTDVQWAAPVIVGDRGSAIVLEVRGDGDAVRFEVRSQSQDSTIVHSSGRIERVLEPNSSRASLAEIKARCARDLSRQAFYRDLEARGLSYGPFFRIVDGVWVGRGEALGRLELPASSDDDEYALHPALMDAALHIVAAALPGTETGGEPLLPFAADRVEIARKIPASAYSHVESRGPNRVDVTVLDAEGRVCVHVRNLAFRPKVSRDTLRTYAPCWERQPLETPETPLGAGYTVLIVAPRHAAPLGDRIAREHAGAQVVNIAVERDGLSEELLTRTLRTTPKVDVLYFLGCASDELPPGRSVTGDAQEQSVIALHRLIRHLDRQGFAAQSLRLKVVTHRAFDFGGDASWQPWQAALVGCCSCLPKEYPHWKIACLDVSVDDVEVVAQRAVAEPCATRVVPVVWAGARYVRRLARLAMPVATEAPFRQRGVYLILGGLGAVGFDTSLYLARTYRARLVVLGRSRLDSALQRRIDAIAEAGAEVVYVRGDAAEPGTLTEAVAKTKERWGALHGIIHSAMVLTTVPVRDLNEGALRAALAPKTDASRYLFDAVRDEPLDFVMCYSSGASFDGQSGLTAYAAGCAFQDALAMREARTAPFRVRVVNWGFWHAGEDADRREALRRLEAVGVEAITPRAGMAALELVLAADVQQVLATTMTERQLAATSLLTPVELQVVSPPVPSGAGRLAEPRLADRDRLGRLERYVRGNAAAERLGASLLLATIQRMGALRQPGDVVGYAQLRTGLAVGADHFRLYDALMDSLRVAGLVAIEGDRVVATRDVDSPAARRAAAEPDNVIAAFALEHPETVPLVTLLARCVNALPEVLTGSTTSTDVLFPGGSMTQVSAIYEDNAIADECNEVVTSVLRQYVAARLDVDASATITLLEVGAGTGSTTRRVVEALAPYAERIRYTYTDVSTSFVRHGKATFGSINPWMDFSVLDIEQPLSAQSFSAGSYDVVLGANVFHATRDIADTISRAKRLLRARGLLVVNEGTGAERALTLIFGLTGGWWRFEDVETRRRHSPLLDVGRWKGVLAMSGFRHVQIHGLPDTPAGPVCQHVIVAESDGLVRPESERARDADRRHKTRAVIAAPSVENEAPVADLRPATEEFVKSVFSRVLEMPAFEFDTEATFEQYGIDSLVVLELNKAFGQHFGRVPPTLLFERSTVAQLARYFIDEHREALHRVLGVAQEPVAVLEGPRAPDVTTQRAAVPAPGRRDITIDSNVASLVDHLSDADVDELYAQLVELLDRSEGA